MRKILSVLLVCAVICSCSVVPKKAPYEKNNFRFIVMGDNRPWWKGKDIVTQNEYFIGNIKRANACKPDFAVIVGDLIHGYTDNADLINREWDAYGEVCKRFNMAYISVVGNHDIWDKQSQEIWLKRYGPLYFSWDYKRCHFIALCTEIVGEMNKITGEQLEWLKADLKKATSARRIFVFMHKPLWAYDPKGKESQNQWNREVHPILAQYGVDTVFAGHWHQYTLYPKRDGVRYVITGGAGAEFYGGELRGEFYHFITVDVKGDSATFKVVTAEKELPPDCVTSEKIKALKKAVSLEPLVELPMDKPVLMKLDIENPTDMDVEAIVKWKQDDSSWEIESAKCHIPAGGKRVLDIKAGIDGEILPLPNGSVEFKRGKRKLFRWKLAIDCGRYMPLITEWNVTGPFDLGFTDETEDRKQDEKPYKTAYMKGWDGLLPPEEGVDLTAVYKGKGTKDVRWQEVKADEQGFIDIDALYEDTDYAVACAVAYIYSPEGGEYKISVGSDDSILVRINGKEVWRNRALRGAAPDQDVFNAELRKGWNEILLKIADRWGDWGFYFRIIDPAKTLKFSKGNS